MSPVRPDRRPHSFRGGRLALAALTLLTLLAGLPRAGANPTVRSVGPFDITFYNSGDSDGTNSSIADWTATQMDDVSASIAAWAGRIGNTSSRQIKLHMFWYEFGNTSVLGDSFSPSYGDGVSSWSYPERVWRDGGSIPSNRWQNFDVSIRYDVTAAGYAWNFGEAAPTTGQLDFRSVVTHEIGHAIGFRDTYSSSADTWGNTYGSRFNPYSWAGYQGLGAWDSFMRDDAGNAPANGLVGTPGNFNETDNPVWWVGPSASAYYGGDVPVYAPAVYNGGSSLSHVDETLLRNALMSPQLGPGQSVRAPTRLEWEMMRDMGWDVVTSRTWTGAAGTGDWANPANWSPDGVPTLVDDIVFTAAGLANGATVTIAGNQYGDRIRLLGCDGDFTIAGSAGSISLGSGHIFRSSDSTGRQTISRSITLLGNGVWDINGGGELVLAAAVVGSGRSVEKRGDGVLVLSGTNSFSGGFSLISGVVRVGNNSALGGLTGPLRLFGGEVTSANSVSYTIRNAVTFGGDVTLGSAENAFRGGLTFTGGAVLAGDRVLTVDGEVAFATNAISGGYSLTKAGPGNMTLTDTHTFGGAGRAFRVTGGSVSTASDASLGHPETALVLDGGALHATGSFATVRPVLVGEGGAIFNVDAGQNLTLNGVLGDELQLSLSASTLNLEQDATQSWSADATLDQSGGDYLPLALSVEPGLPLGLDGSGGGPPVATPEPGSLGLLLLGAAALLARRRRRQGQV